MLQKIKLTCFQQHRDMAIEFEPGVNAIRGSVEAGKSTVLRGIAYALFGSKALPNTLDETVTYGEPVSKLRVELDFQHLGIDYHVYRAKSGAELNWAGGKVTGQDAVTQEIERLFDTDAKMAGKTRIASQKQLAGDFTEGSAGAARMIEALADFDLLDVIKDKIQSELPSGNTTSLEGRIALLAEQSEGVAIENLDPLRDAVQSAEKLYAQTTEALQGARARLAEIRAKEPTKVLDALATAAKTADNLVAKASDLKARASVPTPAAPSDAEMEKLRAAHEASKRVTAALVLHTELQAADTQMLWDEPRAALDAEIVKVSSSVEQLEAQHKEKSKRLMEIISADGETLSGLKSSLAEVRAKVIKEKTCALCQKDLSDVPEVVAINADLDTRITALQKQITDHQEWSAGRKADLQDELSAAAGAIADLKEELSQLRNVVRVAEKLAPLYTRAAEYIELDESVVPAQWKWTGPTSGNTNAAEAVFAAEKQRREAEAHRGAVAEAQRQLGQVEADLEAAREAVLTLAGQKAEAEALVEELETLAEHEDGLMGEHVKANQTLGAAKAALQRAEDSNAAAAKAQATAKEQLAAAQAELVEMQANNALVKKVAAARPVITDKLWGMVLGAASSYLTTMRGIASAITRADGRFLVNGKDASHLSGSAADCLGLALRVGLTRTFIPTAPFLILDEPAAACNDERESAMLGLLATLGFQQVILITHSDLCEAFADNLIRIE